MRCRKMSCGSIMQEPLPSFALVWQVCLFWGFFLRNRSETAPEWAVPENDCRSPGQCIMYAYISIDSLWLNRRFAEWQGRGYLGEKKPTGEVGFFSFGLSW